MDRVGQRDQRMVVVCVELCVAVVSPVGETVVPLEVDVEPVTTPLTLVVFSLWLSTDAGGGVAGVVVVCVVVLEEEDCAKAPPVIRATAIVAASTCFDHLNVSRDKVRAGIARLVVYLAMLMGSRQDRKLLNRCRGVICTSHHRAAVGMIVAMPAIAITARFDDAAGQRE